MRNLLVFIFILTIRLEAAQSPLFSSLDPTSISQNLAYYQLYPETPEGKKALQQALALLSQNKSGTSASLQTLPQTALALPAIIALINKQSFDQSFSLSDQELRLIDQFSLSLAHHRLKGHQATTEEEVLRLPPEEIDLARGLFLSQLGADQLRQVRTYEAMIDLIALQIVARLPKNPTHEEKIRAINATIFDEMEFRFPPHSLYAKDIDLYTFLPSVLDSRRGVCLGVSLLYLCIAQRLDLPLEIITPPGHIYVRYRSPKGVINIETTARGIHLDSEVYLGVNTRKLQERTLKEAIGLAYINQASVYWIHEKYNEALSCYSTASKYVTEDPLLKELMGYNYILLGEEGKAKACLREIANITPDHVVAKETLPNEYLEGLVDQEGISAVFMHVDENRISLLEKKEKLEAVLKKHPQFKTGWMNLGTTLLQLYREGDALAILQKYHEMDPNNPTAEYILTVLNGKRLNYPQAWKHFEQAERLITARDHHPKIIKELKLDLTVAFPK